MNVFKLRKALEGMPDDMPVMVLSDTFGVLIPALKVTVQPANGESGYDIDVLLID